MGKIKEYLAGLSEEELKALMSKIATVNSPEELIEISKENGIELSAERAQKMFEGIRTDEDIADSDLETISGGCSSHNNQEVC